MEIIKYIIKLVRNCFSKIWNKQFLIFLFFLALSSSFWLFLALNDTYEKEFEIPLKLTNVPENVVITTNLPSSVRLTLKGKGITLLNYSYAHKFAPISIDFNAYANTSGHVSILTSDILRKLISKLAPGTQVVGSRPDTIDFYFNYGLCKKVPIKLQGRFGTRATYYISQIRINPDSVTVYASKSILDTITAAYLTPMQMGSLSDTVTTNPKIMSVKGAKFEPSSVTVSFFVDRLVEKTVQVPIQWVNFPGSKVLRTFPSKVNVTFQVGMGSYRSITADNFVLVVNYEDLMNNKSNTCHLSLKTIPAGVTHVRINPQDVEYVIEEIPEN